MNIFLGIVLIVLAGLGAGCTSRTGYEMLRLNQDLRCQELQGADRDACEQQNSMSYDEYQRQLKERDQNK